MKRIISMILLVISLASLISCKDKSLILYEAYACNNGSSAFTDLDTGDVSYKKARKTYLLPESKSSVKKNVSQKEILLGERAILLDYQNTYNKPYCEYNVDSFLNNDYSIRVNFREDDGTIDYLRLGNYDYKITAKEIDSEEALVEACNNYLLTLIDSLDKYNIKIETKIQKIDENGLNNIALDGFSPASEHKLSVVTYELKYEYFIDEIKTAEGITISIDSQGFLKSVSLNMINSFECFSSVDIDEQLCNQVISEEINFMCDVDDYEFSGYTDSKVLIILEQKLCVFSYVTPVYNANDDFYAAPIEIIVPVAE